VLEVLSIVIEILQYQNGTLDPGVLKKKEDIK
jgi:hypothetical protein